MILLFKNKIIHSLVSDQFVSSEWIDYLINASQFSSPKHDFRQIGPRIFQFLSDFCQLAKDGMITLVESEDVFKAKAYEMINAFKSAAAKELASTFDIILLTTSTNKLISNIYTSSYSKRRRAKQKLVPIIPMEYSKNCSCHMSYHCTQNMTLRNGFNGDEFQVTGLRIGCYVVQALLQSTLQCFYNSTCINQIQSILNYSTTINIIVLNHSSSFQSNSTIQHLIEQSMIDQWFENVSYKFYYEKCQPSHCIFTYNSRNDLIYIVTYLFGIIGGLAMVLMIIIPPIVKFIRRKQRPVTNVQIHHDTIARDISISERLGHLKKQLIDALIKFNIIRSYPPAISQYDITSLVTVTRSVRILSPSLSLYLKLYEKYPETLSCPCTSLLIDYGEFISLNFELHPICRSDFVSEKWTNPLINVSSEMNEAYQYLQSFAYWGPLFFRLLFDVCQLSEKTIYHNLALFNSTSLITVYLLPNNTFYRSSEMFIDLFEQNLIQSLNQSMSLIRITSLGNGHVSPIALRGFDGFNGSLNEDININLTYLMFYDYGTTLLGHCQCTLRSFCKFQAQIGGWTIPGIYWSCSTMEATLISNVQCLFNDTCLKTLELEMARANMPVHSKIIDLKLLNRNIFHPNSSIQQIFDHSMVNQWKKNVSFRSYFDRCKPSVCTYTFNKRSDLTNIITTILGLFGGLTTLLVNLVPPIIKFIRNKMTRNQTNIDISNGQRVKIIWIKMKNYFKNYNVFRWNLSIDPHEIKSEIISTRILIFLFILSVMILSFYLFLAVVSGIVPVENPSFEDYNQLVAEYDSVECSCSSISIPYGQFIEINTEYHQICYSAFVEERWIEYFSDAMYWAWYLHLNERVPYRSNLAFHTAGGRSLAVFSALCHRANALQTVERTDSYVMFMANHLEGTSVYQTYGNNNCSCQYPTSDCYQEAQFFRYHTRNYSTTYQFSSTGFYTGCYIMQSLRHSTLEFFYNQTNVDKLPDAITVAGFPLYPDEVKHLAILNVSLNNPKEIVGQVLDRMLVERWNRSVSYQSYFEECNSTEC
ncbi:unnamed protein product, partial [Adineta steineri]